MQAPRIGKFATRVVAVFGLAVALAFLFSRAFIPSGRLTLTDDFVNPVPYLSEAKPTERLGQATVASDGTPRTPLLGSPLFVDLTPPPGFDTATVTLSYQNVGHPMVEIGALASSIDGQFQMQPVENRVIDSLPWKRVTSGSLTLYERHDRYASVDEFFRDPPPRSVLATYRADAGVPYRLDGYASSDVSREINVSLRGHVRMLTYVKDEPLAFTLTVQDMNRTLGADPVTVSVYEGDAKEPIARTILPDDGNTGDDQHSSKLREIPVTVNAPREGFYKIEFTASADVFIRKIATKQQKLVFEDDLYVGDSVGFSDKVDPLTVYTDGGRLAARTPHAEAVQTMTVGGSPLKIDQPNVRYDQALHGGGGLTAITTPKRDVLLQTVGLFALSPNDYFDPLPYSMQWYTASADLDALGIDYVLSSYEPPSVDGGLITGKATFDLRKLAKTEEGAYRLVIEAPGIEETRYSLLLASLAVSLQRAPLTLTTAVPGIFDAFRPEPMRSAEIMTDGRTYGEAPE